MNNVLVHCHWTKMTCHFLTELELHSHVACPSQHHQLQRCQRTPSAYLPEKGVESPSDITDVMLFVNAPFPQIFMESILQTKRDREQLSFNITLLRKHYLNRKGKGESQQDTWGLSPVIHGKEGQIPKENGKEALSFKCKKDVHLGEGLEDIYKAPGFWKLVVYKKIQVVEQLRPHVYPLSLWEPQNGLVWKDLKYYLEPTHLPWGGKLPLDQGAQSPIQPSLKHLQGYRVHKFFGQHVSVPHHPHS